MLKFQQLLEVLTNVLTKRSANVTLPGFEGILPRIFPRLEIISALSSGTSMALYKKKCLPYLGHLKIMSLMYGSSEAFFGINIRGPDEEPAYALMPSMALVEFLPVDSTGTPLEGATPLLATEVKVSCDRESR